MQEWARHSKALPAVRGETQKLSIESGRAERGSLVHVELPFPLHWRGLAKISARQAFGLMSSGRETSSEEDEADLHPGVGFANLK